MNKQRFCAAVRSVRQDEKLTLRQLGERSGINAAQLSKIEHGAFPTKITTIAKIQKGLGLTNDRLLSFLGFKNKDYVKIPVITPHVKNFARALVKAPTITTAEEHVPNHSFLVKTDNNVKPLIRKGSYALVNRNYRLKNNKIYAILINNHHILVGRGFMSKDDTYRVLIADDKPYFNMDYLGRNRLLGQVIKVIDQLT